MKKWYQLLLCGAALTALMTCGALAADDFVHANTVASGANVSCTMSGDKAVDFTATYTNAGLTDGDQYVLLVVRLTSGDVSDPAAITSSNYEVSENSILYIDQAPLSGGTVEFQNFIPRSVTDSVILLGGEGLSSSPLVLGTIQGHGVEVTGKVKYWISNPWSVTITVKDSSSSTVDTITTNTDGSFTTTLPEGDYDFVVSADGYLDYSYPVTVEDGGLPLSLTYSNCFGNVDNDRVVGSTDLDRLLSDYNKAFASMTWHSSSDHAAKVGSNDLDRLINNYNNRTNLPE